MGMGLQANPKLGSLFDGSGGFPLAGALCGIEPVWASEVEPYPIAVTRERFPNMKHLGDISKINGSEIEPVDIITFGSPCQDLSVAGKRAGLKHESNGDEETTRSGLFMEAVRIIKEMRDATNGVLPRFALWENVPGAFSSNKGEDFRIVLEELIKIAEPDAVMPPVPEKGWAYADCYIGDGWSIAYRVFDAQYWGVPQRRRRIHLVCDFSGQCAGKVLFEREGVRGYFETGRAQGEGITPDAQGSLGATDREGEGFDGYNGDLTGSVSATLGVNCGMSTGRNGVIERRRQLAELNLPIYAIDKESWTSGQGFDRAPGITEGGPSPTLQTSGTVHAVAIPVAYRQGGFAEHIEGEVGTLRASGGDFGGGSETLICQEVVHGMDCRNGRLNGDLCGTLQAKPNGGFSYNCIHPVVIERPPTYIVRRLTPTECARLQGFPDYWGHFHEKTGMTEEEYRFWLEVRNTHARINVKAEKEYTKAQMLTWYNKLHTDSAEYKMWGNGIALPPALYCMQGIVEALTNQKTK